jgi:isopentenyl-diphosphate Delta-isomerase
MQQHPSMAENVVLVNERDEEIGSMEKLEAHRKGVLHRAFSIFLFDGAGRLLMQRRAAEKYHSGGLWTNTCCSHPRQGETLEQAAQRRLQEEMGLEAPLEHRFSFIYRAAFDNGLVEHEFDHVFFGQLTGTPVPDPAEVEAWELVPVAELDDALRTHPDRYTAWLRDCWPRVLEETRRTP